MDLRGRRDTNWHAQVDPFRLRIATAAVQVHGLVRDGAHAGSIAADEVARQAEFAVEWGTLPASNAHGHAYLLNTAGVTHLEALCTLLADERAHPFSGPVLLRASLEAFARGLWLSEPALGLKRRVCRHASLRLADYHANWGKGFDAETEPRIRRSCDKLGLRVRYGGKGKPPTVEGVVVPSASKAISDMFLGLMRDRPFIYNRLSALAHASPAHLSVSLTALENALPDDNGMVPASVGITAQEALVSLLYGLWALREAANRWMILLGVDGAAWNADSLAVFDELQQADEARHLAEGQRQDQDRQRASAGLRLP